MLTVEREFIEEANTVIERTLTTFDHTLRLNWGNTPHSEKEDRTVVTSLDRAVEEALREDLHKLDSSIGIIGEEFGQEGSTERYWLIDPIDGTEQFVRGLRGCLSMISLVDRGEPQLTVIRDFIGLDYYRAITGEGATKDGEPIHVSNRPLERAWVEFSYNNGELPVEAALTLDGLVHSVVRTKAGVSMFNGGIDGIVSINGMGKEWDYVPRTHMIREAGGIVANIGVETYDSANTTFIAANPVIYAALQEALSDKV